MPPPGTRGITMASTSTAAPIMTAQQFLESWQGHRTLTRRVIDAFPEDKLFTFSIGGMRPFSTLAIEFLQMAAPTLRGVITGTWPSMESIEAKTKADLLQLWD